MRACMIPRALLLVLALAVGCSDANLPTAGPSESTPTFSVADGPENPGNSLVFKFQNVVFTTTIDPEADLVARHYDAINAPFCDGTDFPLQDIQWVTDPQHEFEVVRRLVQSDGEIPVVIYRLSEVPPGLPDCDDLANLWLYRGTHRFRGQDNNLFFDPSHTNSWGWNAQGKVYDRAGDRFHYNEHSRFVIDPDPFRILHVSDVISVK